MFISLFYQFFPLTDQSLQPIVLLHMLPTQGLTPATHSDPTEGEVVEETTSDPTHFHSDPTEKGEVETISRPTFQGEVEVHTTFLVETPSDPTQQEETPSDPSQQEVVEVELTSVASVPGKYF